MHPCGPLFGSDNKITNSVSGIPIIASQRGTTSVLQRCRSQRKLSPVLAVVSFHVGAGGDFPSCITQLVVILIHHAVRLGYGPTVLDDERAKRA